jgi:hypothetical protein
MDKKYQVFISSTYEDLIDQRTAVVKAVLEMGHIPVGMEMFSAADEEQWRIITSHIDQSDYYVVLVAHRYGSVVDGNSYTEKEYDYAVAARIPVLGFVIEESAEWPGDRFERSATAQLDNFKSKVKQKPVGFWTTTTQLAGQVAIALGKQFTSRPRPGWIRGDQAAGPEVLGEIARLSRENSEMRQRLSVSTNPELVFELVSGIVTYETYSNGSTCQLDATFAVHSKNSLTAGFIIRKQTAVVSVGDRTIGLAGSNVVISGDGVSHSSLHITIAGSGLFRAIWFSPKDVDFPFLIEKQLDCIWEFHPVGYSSIYQANASFLGSGKAGSFTWLAGELAAQAKS